MANKCTIGTFASGTPDPPCDLCQALDWGYTPAVVYAMSIYGYYSRMCDYCFELYGLEKDAKILNKKE